MTEQEKKQAEEHAETRKDMYFMMGLMVVIVFITSVVMVCAFT